MRYIVSVEGRYSKNIFALMMSTLSRGQRPNMFAKDEDTKSASPPDGEKALGRKQALTCKRPAKAGKRLMGKQR